MIDSINLVIEGIERLDKDYLIYVLKVENYYVDKEHYFISFVYKKIHFVFYYNFKNLAITTTTHKILNKRDITIEDKEEFRNRVNNIINEILKSSNILYNMKLTQIDFCVDIFLGNELKEYYEIINRHYSKYRSKRKRRTYDTSIQITSKNGRILKIYDKEMEMSKKTKELEIAIKRGILNDGEKIRETKEEENLYKGYMRLEIANRKSNLKYYLKSSKKKNKSKIEVRTIDNYWNKEKMEKLFFNEFESYLFLGDYYKLDKAKMIIKNNNELSQKWKEKLINMLISIKINGIETVKKEMVGGTFRNYIKKLNSLNINPITISEDSEYDKLDNLYKLAVKTAEEKYFK